MKRLFLLFALATTGCTRVEVHKNPCEHDLGIRYYRPKPYLLITPGDVGGGGSESLFSVSQGAPLKVEGLVNQASHETPPAEDCPRDDGRPKQISMAIQYLPDFAEEYSIQLKPGLGVGELNIELENGWNLTSLGAKTDQQTDEILNSVANVANAVAGLGGAKETKARDDGTPKPCVYATNVPFGFYEAVIARGPCGEKQLYGWRYVGFMPFQTCPTTACGMQAIDCQCDGIYGLVWVDGILQFARIGQIPTDPVLTCKHDDPKCQQTAAGALPAQAAQPKPAFWNQH